MAVVRGLLERGVWTNLAMALASGITLAADAALGVTATADWLWQLVVS